MVVNRVAHDDRQRQQKLLRVSGSRAQQGHIAGCRRLLQLPQLGPAGAANEAIGAVREKFDTAAHALVECTTLVDPNVDPVQFLEHTDDKARYAWQAIKPNIDTVTRIAALVTQFSCKSSTFSLIELPVQVGGTGFLDAAH